MTRVDFHSNLRDRLGYACRLIRKAVGSGMHVVVLGDDATLRRFDTQLWSFSALDFIPHCAANHPLAAETPVVLAEALDDVPHHQVLLNLGGDIPDLFARFERVLELVGDSPEEINAGRTRYRFYKERGYPLQHFDQSGSV